MFHNNKMSEILQPYVGVERVLGRERECTPLVKIDQDGRGLSILAFCEPQEYFLSHGGNNWLQEEVIKSLLLGRRHSELPWDHLSLSHHAKAS